MKAWKIVVIVLGALFLSGVLMIGTCFGGLFYVTKGVAEAGDRFVQTCGAHKLHDCYLLTSDAWRARQDEAAFAADMRARGLDRGRAVSWTSRSVTNDAGQVSGELTLSDGRTVPIALDLVRENGQWHPTALTQPPAGAAPATPSTTL
jgi:hypothetical protein